MMPLRAHARLMVLGAVLAVLIGGICLYGYTHPAFFVRMPVVQGLVYERAAAGVVAACAHEAYRPTCYDVRIPLLMDNGFSMEDAFAVTQRVQRKDTAYAYCHVLGHNLAAKETAKDPDAWTQVLKRCPTGVCANGCLHGAVQQRFRSDVLSSTEIAHMLPDLATVCESGPDKTYTGLEQPICYHGLGHFGMYATGGNTEAALQICESLDALATANGSVNDVQERCFEGVFMSMFQFLDDEDRALVKNEEPKTAQEASAYCAQFSGARKAACHRESWPLHWDTVQTGAGLTAFCAYMPEAEYMQDCYNVLFNIITAMFNFDQSRIATLCEELPKNRMAQCFAHSASRFIDTDQQLAHEAASMCARAEKNGVGTRCYEELLFYAVYSYHEGSASFTALCSALPGAWKSKCLAGDGKNIPTHVLDI